MQDCDSCHLKFCWVCGLPKDHKFHDLQKARGFDLLCTLVDMTVLSCSGGLLMLGLLVFAILLPISVLILGTKLTWKKLHGKYKQFLEESSQLKSVMCLPLIIVYLLVSLVTSILMGIVALICSVPFLVFYYSRMAYAGCIRSKRVLNNRHQQVVEQRL